MPEKKLYRIGDFAKKLGVTPDLLKYCEKKGIIDSEQESNGYRYYDFRQSATILDYIKLQNMGYSAEEIYSALHSESLSDYIRLQEHHSRQLRRQFSFSGALLDYCRYISESEHYFTDPPTWFLRPHGSMWFLPHSADRELSSDPAVIDRIRQWNDYLPVIMSACRFNDPTHRSSLCWGFLANDAFARENELDVSPPAEYIPAANWLELYITQSLEDHSFDWHGYAHQLLTKLKLKQTGPAFEAVITKIFSTEGRISYSVLYIPVLPES